MTFDYFDNLIMPIIVAGCFCVGFVVKKWLPTDDKWIPTIVCMLGALLGFVLTEQHTPDAIVTGVIAGALSGLASTGVHQLFKQHLQLGAEEMTVAEADVWLDIDKTVLDDMEADNE